jgi:hypothetical protein
VKTSLERTTGFEPATLTLAIRAQSILLPGLIDVGPGRQPFSLHHEGPPMTKIARPFAPRSRPTGPKLVSFAVQARTCTVPVRVCKA